MFTLLALVQKQFAANRKLYVAFIDFEKAFDSLNRNLLWSVLAKNGIRGRLLRCVKSMYNIVRARVRSGSKLTNYINCTSGVKQGDVCSPVLFSLFINELALDIINKGRHGASFSFDAYELFILLLADDVILISETVVGLQTQLNNLHNSACHLRLKVNLNKSNVVVFRKGGYLSVRERWMYDSVTMPVVNAYKYLGIIFSTRLSFAASCRDVASRAKLALINVMKSLFVINNNSLSIFLKIFDSQIQPILQYGAELWGLDESSSIYCEKVHLFALKKFLGVDRRTPNDLVYGETNRYPITLNSAIRCIRYWLKLTRMERYRFPRKSYDMLFNLDAKGKSNWVSKVRLYLFKYGFGYVWLNQGVENMNGFVNVFKERLIDCRWQCWDSHIQTSERFSSYRLFGKSSHEVKPYLLLDIDRHLKYIATKFRCGVSDIATHKFRYRVSTDADLFCPLCKEAVENEVHFVLCCPALNHIRYQLLPAKYYRNPCAFRLALLMSSTHADLVRKFCIYLYKAFAERQTLLNHKCVNSIDIV